MKGQLRVKIQSDLEKSTEYPISRKLSSNKRKEENLPTYKKKSTN